MVTAGIYQKLPILDTPEKLDFVRDMLFEEVERHGFDLQAWAILNNHYHVIVSASDQPEALKNMIVSLHKWSAVKLNRLDEQPGRKVWHNFWDSHITHQTSWLARLRYVHQNPVHHGVVDNASNYPWCSQAWLERTAGTAFVKTLERFNTDTLNVADDF